MTNLADTMSTHSGITRTYGKRICVGCGNEYEATGPNQKRCQTRCGYFGRRLNSKSHRIGGLEFIGVDGEGVTDPDGTHRYVLLSVGDQSLTADVGGRLTFLDIMPFLWDQFLANPHAAFVGFYLSYDFSQWFRDLPVDRARYLLTNWGRGVRSPKGGNRRMPFPVRYGPWEFDMIGNRRFKLRHNPGDDERDYSNNKLPWLYICDTGPFWQMSLLSALDPANWGGEPVLTEDEWQTVKEGKAHRSSAKLDKKMIQYNVTENEALSRAMSRLERGFSANGWNLNKSHWFGPGQAAQLWLNNIHAPLSDAVIEKTPIPVLAAAQASYYGGWFEIPRHGIIPGETYEYDINSAYPHIISSLPCLLHGKWIHNKNTMAGLSLVHITSHGSSPYTGGLPHRDRKGIISRPQNTKGWYWLHEVQAAERAGLIDQYEIHESWTYKACKCAPPLYSIANLYNQRLEVGKNTPHGKALKLVYNSSYGKFAQSIGEPKYANAIYASLITAGCRTMILDAIATHPDKAKAVMMVATDGVYFRTPHPTLTISPDTLGAWDYGVKNNLTLFMPGVYWDDKSRRALKHGEAPKLKSRGINAAELATQVYFIDAWWKTFDDLAGSRRDLMWPNVLVPIRFQVTSPQLALARNKWETCGLVKTERDNMTKNLSSDPSNKRDTGPNGVTSYREDGLITTRPYEDKGESWGYNKSFGMTLENLQLFDEMITDDGTIQREIIEMLGNG